MADDEHNSCIILGDLVGLYLWKKKRNKCCLLEGTWSGFQDKVCGIFKPQAHLTLIFNKNWVSGTS